jgi:hypothetical protein
MYTQKCHKETPHTVILNKQKCHIFFSFREGRTGPVWGIGTSGRREEVRKGCGRMNMVQILCTHVCKWENETCSNYSRNGGRGDKRKMMEGVNSTTMYYKNFGKCHNVPPAQQ